MARNDLSRNCHDVRVVFYKEPQYYSHVIHLVSRVSGALNNGANPLKTFIDTFPAGTLSGAPKVRAMQLISEIEPHNRGAYGGCIGFIGLNGRIEPGDNDPHFRKPQQRIVVPGRRRYRSTQSGRIRTARSQ